VAGAVAVGAIAMCGVMRRGGLLGRFGQGWSYYESAHGCRPAPFPFEYDASDVGVSGLSGGAL